MGSWAKVVDSDLWDCLWSAGCGIVGFGFWGVVVCYLGAVVTCCLWFGGVGLCNCLVVDFCLVFWVYLRARC